MSAQYDAARATWADYRADHGLARLSPPLLTAPSSNLKLDRTASMVYGLSLAQSRLSGYNVCPYSTPNCIAACVGNNGMGRYDSVQFARIVKTRFYFEHRAVFLLLLETEIHGAIARHDGNVTFRLNTFSDIDWPRVAPWLFDIPGFNAYDYTKDLARRAPANYSLTHSATERTSVADITAAVERGQNVAVVLAVRGGKVGRSGKYRPIGDTFHGLPMIDGDLSDNRALDAPGHVVGLRAKGKMNGLPMAKVLVA